MPRTEAQRAARNARRKALRKRKRAAWLKAKRLFVEHLRRIEHPFSSDPEDAELVAMFKELQCYFITRVENRKFNEVILEW